MSVLFDVNGLNIEFGIIKNNSNYLPYLIDYSIENEESIDLNQISNGVISSGKVTGKLIKMDIGDNVGAIDTHFFNEIKNKTVRYNNVIFACELPSISLLNLLEEVGNNIGFVFKEGSALCHFAVTLREKGIPALVGIDINTLEQSNFDSPLLMIGYLEMSDVIFGST